MIINIPQQFIKRPGYRAFNMLISYVSFTVFVKRFLTTRQSLCFLLKSTICGKSNWDSLYCHKNVPKNIFVSNKSTRVPPSLWSNVVWALKKLCQAVLTKHEQTNLQSTLNKTERGASHTTFVTAVFEWVDFLKRV